MDENKDVTYKKLKIDQEIMGHKLGNLTSSYRAIVKAINSHEVTVSMWGKYDDKIDASSLFQVKLTDKEFEDKYAEKAKESLHGLKNKLHHDEIGCHEMWNTWLYGTPYEIGQHCVQDKIKIVGYCSDIIPKTAMFSGDTLDIGVCAEYENGERFWCHYRFSDIEKMFERHKDLIEEE